MNTSVAGISGTSNMGKRFLHRIGVELLCFWLRTFRIHYSSPIPSNVVFGLWHQDLPACMAAFRNQGITVMISSSKDGEWAALVAKRLGYNVVRGSGSRGQESLRHLTHALENGGCVGMALDGPRGPALQEKPGAKWLVGSSGRKLVYLKMDANPMFRVKSWDRTIIPLPFASIHVHFDG